LILASDGAAHRSWRASVSPILCFGCVSGNAPVVPTFHRRVRDHEQIDAFAGLAV